MERRSRPPGARGSSQSQVTNLWRRCSCRFEPDARPRIPSFQQDGMPPSEPSWLGPDGPCIRQRPGVLVDGFHPTLPADSKCSSTSRHPPCRHRLAGFDFCHRSRHLCPLPATLLLDRGRAPPPSTQPRGPGRHQGPSPNRTPSARPNPPRRSRSRPVRLRRLRRRRR